MDTLPAVVPTAGEFQGMNGQSERGNGAFLLEQDVVKDAHVVAVQGDVDDDGRQTGRQFFRQTLLEA
jgi:hypothetical protein